MSQNSLVLEKLARSLTESERIDFLKQIHASLRDNEYSQKRLVRHESDEEEKKVLLQQDIRRMPPVRYFLLWLRKIFSGKAMTTLYLEVKINKLKKSIRHRNPGMVSFETRTLKPEFAEQVFQVFVNTIPLQNLFRRLWTSDNELSFFHQLVYTLIENTLETKVESCYDLIQIESLIHLYQSGAKKDDLISEIERSIDEYIESIDKQKFAVVEDQLSPLYSIRDLILFPFPKLFQNFHGTIRRDDPETVPLFQRTSAITSMDMIEELYYALNHASKTEIKANFNSHFVELLFEAAYGDEEDENEDESIERAVRVESDEDTFIEDIRNLQGAVQKFMTTVSLPQLIRAFKEDPYYRLVVYVPTIEIQDFYRNMKKLSLRNEIEEIIKQVRQESLTKERGRLFEGVKMKALHYYRSYSSIDYEKMGITSFRFYQGLLVLYNFLTVYYKGPIQRILQILEGFIGEQDRITRERMLKYASAAEDVLYKIRELDDSLSPDQDDGKKFQRLRFESNLDPVQKRIYLTTVGSKDTEAKDLLMKGRDAQRGIRLLFKDFTENQDSLVQEGLARKYLVQGKVSTLHELLQQNMSRIELLERIELQLDQIRDETGFDEVAI